MPEAQRQPQSDYFLFHGGERGVFELVSFRAHLIRSEGQVLGLVVVMVAPLLSHLGLANQEKIVVQRVVRAVCDQLGQPGQPLRISGGPPEPHPPSHG